MSRSYPSPSKLTTTRKGTNVDMLAKMRHPDLANLNSRLEEEVDDDLFRDPGKFRTLQRVIDVLGFLQPHEYHNPSGQSTEALHRHNPAFLALRKQQVLVEESIEYLVANHASDLNASVVAVGKVARQYKEAVSKIKHLKRQVREIKDNLTTKSSGLSDVDAGGKSSSEAASSKNLRELWLKKLECEAVLSLLGKLEIIREAPQAFDTLVGDVPLPTVGFGGAGAGTGTGDGTGAGGGGSSAGKTATPCRIGAAVLLLSESIQTVFSDDVSQIRALHKITEQLMARKQLAEEVLWDALANVVYLRTGNGKATATIAAVAAATAAAAAAGGGGDDHLHHARSSSLSQRYIRASLEGADDEGGGGGGAGSGGGGGVGALGDEQEDDNLEAEDDDLLEQEEAADGGGGGGSFHDVSDDQSVGSVSRNPRKAARKRRGGSGGSKVTTVNTIQRLLPRAILETELDLEADELRCLEDLTLPSVVLSQKEWTMTASGIVLPKYTDAVLALRILLEALVKLGRLDDVERHLLESVEPELRKLAQREQAKTFARLEKRRSEFYAHSKSKKQQEEADLLGLEMRHFRTHLSNLLQSFGSVLLRLSQLAQILRHRIMTDSTIVTPSYANKASALRSVLLAAETAMQREIKGFLRACVNEVERPAQQSQSQAHATAQSPLRRGGGGGAGGTFGDGFGDEGGETGIFSLGIVSASDRTAPASSSSGSHGLAGWSTAGGAGVLGTSSRAAIMALPAEEFVANVMFPRSQADPRIRHALLFRRPVGVWTGECADLQRELAAATGEDTSLPSYNEGTMEEGALDFLDNIIRHALIPMLQDEAVNGTVSALEREDAFEPILDSASSLYGRGGVGAGVGGVGGAAGDAEMCIACQALATATAPLFMALVRLPRGGDMYAPMVAMLEHALLTFISRVKHRAERICGDKTSYYLLERTRSKQSGTKLTEDVELRRPFALLLNSYFEEGSAAATADAPAAGGGGSAGSSGGNGSGAGTSSSSLPSIAPPHVDTKARHDSVGSSGSGGAGGGSSSSLNDLGGASDAALLLLREEEAFQREISHLLPLLDFDEEKYGRDMVLCSDGELMKAACLGHSLLELASRLDGRVRVKSGGFSKILRSTRALREAILNIRAHGLRMAKFCRMEMLLQTVLRMSKICRSSSLVAEDAVRLPSSVNDLGEYLTTASEFLREASGNRLSAYTFSSLEQYIPLFLMQTVRIIARNTTLNGRVTLNGVEALDRSGSVLYRDLKGATSFEGSSWDDEVAANSFERSASYVAMIELDMDELVSYYRSNRLEFSDNDYKLMFCMDGPRRKGDITRYAALKERTEE